MILPVSFDGICVTGRLLSLVVMMSLLPSLALFGRRKSLRGGMLADTKDVVSSGLKKSKIGPKKLHGGLFVPQVAIHP